MSGSEADITAWAASDPLPRNRYVSCRPEETEQDREITGRGHRGFYAFLLEPEMLVCREAFWYLEAAKMRSD